MFLLSIYLDKAWTICISYQSTMWWTNHAPYYIHQHYCVWSSIANRDTIFAMNPCKPLMKFSIFSISWGWAQLGSSSGIETPILVYNFYMSIFLSRSQFACCSSIYVILLGTSYFVKKISDCWALNIQTKCRSLGKKFFTKAKHEAFDLMRSNDQFFIWIQDFFQEHNDGIVIFMQLHALFSKQSIYIVTCMTKQEFRYIDLPTYPFHSKYGPKSFHKFV